MKLGKTKLEQKIKNEKKIDGEKDQNINAKLPKLVITKFKGTPKETKQAESLRFSRVLFGLSTSPFHLGGVIDQHLRNLQQNFPNEVEEVKRSLHVDDLITGVTTVVEKSSPSYFQRREIPAAQMAFKSAIPRRATILRESGRRKFNHSIGSKSQPCHARGGNSGTTTNYCARYRPNLRQVPCGCKDVGNQTARRTVEQNSGLNKSCLSCPNRQSNQDRNLQEDI